LVWGKKISGKFFLESFNLTRVGWVDDKTTLVEKGRISDDLWYLQRGEIDFIFIKTLRGPVKELIVGQYRLVCFGESEIIYVVDAFKKQSRKTPPMKKITKLNFIPFDDFLRENMQNPEFRKGFEDEERRLQSLAAKKVAAKNMKEAQSVTISRKISVAG
jgi:hypothetical protein